MCACSYNVLNRIKILLVMKQTLCYANFLPHQMSEHKLCICCKNQMLASAISLLQSIRNKRYYWMPFPLVDHWVIKPQELPFIGRILGGLEAEFGFDIILTGICIELFHYMNNNYTKNNIGKVTNLYTLYFIHRSRI